MKLCRIQFKYKCTLSFNEFVDEKVFMRMKQMFNTSNQLGAVVTNFILSFIPSSPPATPTPISTQGYIRKYAKRDGIRPHSGSESRHVLHGRCYLTPRQDPKEFFCWISPFATPQASENFFFSYCAMRFFFIPFRPLRKWVIFVSNKDDNFIQKHQRGSGNFWSLV